MPKNAVQRLQDIENDIKTVISLYEVTKSNNKNNDKSEEEKKQSAQQLPKIGAPKRVDIVPRFDKFREVPGQSQAPLKKACGFLAGPPQRLNSREMLPGKKWVTNKPGSAPSSTSTLSTICESDSIRQPSDADTLEKGILSKTKTSDNLSSSEWLDIILPSFKDVVMTPSKTLETAKEVLEKNNFNDNDECKRMETPSFQSASIREEKGTKNSKTPGKQAPPSDANASSQSKKNSAVTDKTQKNEKRNASHVSTTRIVSPTEKHPSGSDIPVLCKYMKGLDTKEKPLVDTSTPLYSGCKDWQREDRKVSSLGGKKTSKSPVAKHVCFKTNKDMEGEDSKHEGFEKGVISQRSYTAVKFEKFSAGNEEKRTLEKDFKLLLPGMDEGPKNQEAQNDDNEWVNELSKVIEENNEKLEKLKVSKELALKIAKHFKKKYDETLKSNEELQEKLQRAEKTNERMVVEAEKMKNETDAAKAEEEILVKETKEENTMLKAKLCETEKQYNAKILQLNQKLEEIQVDRLEENKNGLKAQEMLTRKLQQVTNEKCDLMLKFDDLRRQLHNSKSKTQSLEDNIRQLEEEVHKQKQHLKIKTETLHETNRELEMIRINSSDLEDQVKILRRNIEEFDGIQQSLIKKTTDYEQQIKLNNERIKDLQDQNNKLSQQLENERDDLLIKVKIIEDQQQTIRQLKERAEEAKSLLKRSQSLEKTLNIEREEKLELQEAVQRLKWRKEELKKKVKSLENEFLLAPQEVVRDLQKTQMVLHQLENQVQMKQKEWEFQLNSLIREKEQACNVAEFATKKLMETTSEYQKQSQAYKGLQRIVAGNMAARERNMHQMQKKAR